MSEAASSYSRSARSRSRSERKKRIHTGIDRFNHQVDLTANILTEAYNKAKEIKEESEDYIIEGKADEAVAAISKAFAELQQLRRWASHLAIEGA